MSTIEGRREILAYPISPELLPVEEIVDGRYTLRFARTEEELDALLRLRFEVFNLEMDEGLKESFETQRDRDDFDAVCHHLIVVNTQAGEVVGTYRLQTNEMAQGHLGYYSDIEFDLSGLPEEVLDGAVEVGRACVAKSHRNTQVLFLLWRGLALYMATSRKRFLFGCSSLTSQDPAVGRTFLNLLDRRGHLHPEWAVRPRPGFECWPEDAPPAIGDEIPPPPLFRIYLRHGAKVCGWPAIDREFGTIDFLVLFDVDAMSPKMYRTFFG